MNNQLAKTDAVSMQHDVDYSVCGNKTKSEEVIKCKNEADRKMIKSLDAIPWKEDNAVMLWLEQ